MSHGGGRVAAALSAIILGSTGLLLSSPAPVSAVVPGANGLIAWQKNDAGGSHVWTMWPDGTHQKSVAVGGAPFWAPDGARLYYADGAGLGSIAPDGSDPQHLVDGIHGGTWSPDGTKIAFAAYDNQALNYDIYVANADGSSITNITNNPAQELEPSWSPDGSKIVFSTDRNGPEEIWTMTPTGTALTNLSNGSTGRYPVWSPNGSKIVYAGAGIWTMNANGTSKTRIVTEGMMPTWAPDGSRILFTSHRDYNDELYSVLPDGTGAVRLTNDHATNATYPEDWFAVWQPLAVAFTPGAIAFGDAVVGTATAARAITLKAGDDPVTVDSVGLGGANPGDFQIMSDLCTGKIVAAYGSCAVTVRFLATAVADRSATLVFTGPAALGTMSASLTGFGRLFLWGSQYNAGPAYTWNFGRSMAATASGSTTYLHATYTTDRVSSAWVTDTSPRLGMNYIRSTNGGKTWTTPKRLNPTTQHGNWGAIASSGSYIYAVWVSSTKWVHYSGTAPRILYLRRNTNHGSTTAWGSIVRLTSTTGRVDIPTVAASGAYVYVAYTDSSTGAVKVAISANRGVSWKTVTIGSTTSSNGSGRFGFAHIAVSGSTVAVAWVTNATHSTTVRISTNYGGSWGSPTAMNDAGTIPDIAAVGSRVAVAWITDRVHIRVATSGAWAPQVELPPTDGVASETDWGVTISLLGSSSVGVAYSSCVADCPGSDPGVITRTNLIWRESVDNGATWAPSDTVASSTATSARRENDGASIVWRTAKKPSIYWNGWTEDTLSYRMYIRSGL